MTRFASLFPSPEYAEQAFQTLTGRMGDYIDARILGAEDWNANWSGSEPARKAHRRPPEFYVDLWLNDEAVHYFNEGVRKGGAILVVNVPEELSRQAVRLVKENHGQVM